MKIRSKTSLTALVMSCVLTGGYMGTAHAGHWVISYECEGTFVGPVFFNGSWSATTSWIQNDMRSEVSYVLTEDMVDPEIISQVSANGTITPVFTWTKDGPSDTSEPPTLLKIKETSYVESRGGASQWHIPIISTDNGIGSPVDNGASQGWNPGHYQRRSGSRLLSLDNSMKETVVRFSTPRSLSAIAGVTPLGGEFCDSCGGYNIDLRYKVQLDPRDVSLSRPGAIGERHDISSNTTYGDSIYSYESKECVSASDCLLTHSVLEKNEQTFNANHLSWPSYSSATWQWTPSEVGDTVSEHEQEMPTGTLYDDSVYAEIWDGTPTGQSQKIVNYKITDSADGAQATAKYVLTLHDPFEVRADSPAQTIEAKRFDFPVKLYSVNEASSTEPKAVEWNAEWTGNVSLAFTSSLNLPIESLVKLGVGANFSATGELKVTVPTSASTSIPPGKKTYPYFDYEIATKHFLIDKYSKEGQIKNPGRVNPNGSGDGSWPNKEEHLYSITPRWSAPVDLSVIED
jgi:hypothetical protein